MVAPRSREGEGSRQLLPARQQLEVEEEDGEEDDEGPCGSYFRFRGSTYSLFKVISYWKQYIGYYAACKKEVEKARFGGLLDLRMPKISQYSKKVFNFTPEDVARVYGLPLGGAVIDLKYVEGGTLDSFSKDIGMIPNRSLNVPVKDLMELAIPAKGPRPPVAMVVKQFLLLATGSLLVPTFARRCKLDFAAYIGGSIEDVRVLDDKPCMWVLGDCYFLILHLLDSLIGGRYDLAAALLSREEIASCNQPATTEGTSATAVSSLAPPPARAPMPTMEWWETEDLTSLQLEQLKGLKEMTESMIEKWVARRDKVQRFVENLEQQE
ncbi:unnamed protein product [Linum trigynum]|uniref:Uncharacterized protein n=1 Tax=Linum trigynum TaxID=586398 RepID=A0AAV2CF03_9ROSI